MGAADIRHSTFDIRTQVLWYSFLAVWSFSQLVYGAVAPWALAATVAALAALNLVAWRLLPGPAGLGRGGTLFLAAVAAVFALQFLPIAPLYPYTTALRRAHGTGVLWPGTADSFLTARALALVSAYALSALFVIRLRRAGLSTERMLKGVCVVLVLHGLYALVRVFFGVHGVPFFGAVPSDASGLLVNRNSFAGLMGMGLAIAAGLAIARFTWPSRHGRRVESGLPWAGAAALFAVCVVLSASRGGVIAAVTGLAVTPFLLRGRFSAAGTALLVLLGAVAVVAANPTVLMERFGQIDPYEVGESDRWTIWSTTAAAAARQPVLGFGIGTHPQAYHPFQPMSQQMNHAHSEYVNAFFEGGALWLALLVGGLIFWFRRARRASRLTHGPDRIVGAGVLAGVLVMAVHSFVDFDLQITAVGILFAVLIGTATPRAEDAARRAAVFPVAAVVALVASVAAIALATDDPARRSLALSPYDYRAAWLYAKAAGDDRTGDLRRETAADLFPAHPALQSDAGFHFWDRWVATGDRVQLQRAARCWRRLFERQPSVVPRVMGEIWVRERPQAEYEELLPEDPQAAAEMAGFLVGRTRWKEGMELFTRRCPERASSAAAYDRFAAALEEAGQWGMQADVLERRLKLKSDADAYAAAARAWSRLGVHERAVERAAMGVRIDPADASRRALLGDALRAKGDWTAALAAYTEAVRKAPLEPLHRLRRAELYLEQKMWSDAAQDLREVARSRPDDGSVAIKLARALEAGGDREGAIVTLQVYLSRHAGDAAAKALLEALEK